MPALCYREDRYREALTSKNIRVRWIATGNSGPWNRGFQRRLVPPAYQDRSPLFFLFLPPHYAHLSSHDGCYFWSSLPTCFFHPLIFFLSLLLFSSFQISNCLSDFNCTRKSITLNDSYICNFIPEGNWLARVYV